ncbi:MAG: MarR family transcriptional regulator [archaeon]|nr:MarR family transcriptional regulator [archaeon]
MTDARFAGLEIKKLEILLSRYAISYLKKYDADLCPLQTEALVVIHDNGGSMVQKHLESILGIRKSTLSGMLNTMIKNGFIEKRDSETDQRSKVVCLTRKGEEFYDTALRDLVLLDNTITAGIPPEDLETMMRVIDRMRSNVEDD